MRHVHSDRLERWLGAAQVELISLAMRDWYGPPIALGCTPGAVYALPGGDFGGRLQAGGFASLLDQQYERYKRWMRRFSRLQHGKLNAGSFASLSDLIAAATAGGQRYDYFWHKEGTTGVAGVTNSLWRCGTHPAAGANASNAPGGDAPTDATAGAIAFANPTGGKHQFLTTAFSLASQNGSPALLYDRIFQVNKTMSSTGTESVTGVPSRYQNTVAGSEDSAEGNFLFVETGAALSATAHNWTTCLYTDQGGTGSATLPSITGNSSGIINRLDHPANQWFAPLATGDTGLQQLDQMQCSASVTGTINFVIGHPLMWLPHTIANVMSVVDGINSLFSLARVFDDAALALLEVTKPVTTATNYNSHAMAYAG